MKMNLLAFVTPPSIYHGCTTWKKFWGKNFTGEEKFPLGDFSAVNMKNCCCREIKGSDNYATLDISLKFGSLDKTRIKYSEPKDNLGRSGKGLITSLGLKAKTRPNEYKKARYAIGNISMKDFSKIIREFEKMPYRSYERRRTKHEPTDSYFYLAIHIAKCMMRADALNLMVYPVRTEITGTKNIPILHVCLFYR